MSEETLDLDEFLERVQDDKELLVELLDIYTEDFQNKRKLLGEAVKNSNFEEISSIAHSLKGASGNISAKSLMEFFLEFEEKSKSSDLSGADDLLTNIDKSFEALSARISTIKDEYKS